MAILERILDFMAGGSGMRSRSGETTRVTVISDTHERHEELRLPAGDLLIHCGDLFNLFQSDPVQLEKLDDWFGRQAFNRIICTGGNHDRILESALAKDAQPFKNAHYLQDELLLYRGLMIYGTPWVPGLPTHAFHKNRSGLEQAWSRIPADLDILVTHTPPKGILDISSNGASLGCVSLAEELKRIVPRVHCFGHVHASAGQTRIGETLFVNASSISSRGADMRQPISFTLRCRS